MNGQWRWPNAQLISKTCRNSQGCTNLPGTVDATRFRHVQTGPGVIWIKPNDESRNTEWSDAS